MKFSADVLADGSIISYEKEMNPQDNGGRVSDLLCKFFSCLRKDMEDTFQKEDYTVISVCDENGTEIYRR